MIMIEMLLTVEIYAWTADFAVLCVVFILAIKDQRVSSSLIAITVSVLIGGIMHQLTPILLTIDDPELLPIKLFGWYMGFVSFDTLGIYVIYKIHKIFNINYQFIARMIMLQLFVLGQLQLLRYTERLIFDSDYLMALYKSGVIGINITTALVALIFALVVSYSKYRVNRGKQGVKWII
jgi:hypothetical protein